MRLCFVLLLTAAVIAELTDEISGAGIERYYRRKYGEEILTVSPLDITPSTCEQPTSEFSTASTSGENGEDGENGENGEDGGSGEGGEDGEDGQNGENGEDGDSAETQSTGSSAPTTPTYSTSDSAIPTVSELPNKEPVPVVTYSDSSYELDPLRHKKTIKIKRKRITTKRRKNLKKIKITKKSKRKSS